MGLRGPRPTPSAILKQRGTYRADRAGKREVNAPRGSARPPAWLDTLARRMWNQTVPILLKMKVLSRADRNALIRYCTYWSRWVKAEQWLAKHGTSYPIRDGNGKTKSIGQFPQVSEASKLGMLLARLEQEFGLTPSARARIECSEEDEDESIEDYLERRRDEEEFFGKPVQGQSAEQILELMRVAKGPPGLKIDEPEPRVGNAGEQNSSGENPGSFKEFLRRANEDR